MFHYCKLYSLEPPKLADSYPHRSSSPLCSSAVRIALKIESWMTAHWTPVDLRLLCIWLCTLPLIYLLHYTPSLPPPPTVIFSTVLFQQTSPVPSVTAKPPYSPLGSIHQASCTIFAKASSRAHQPPCGSECAEEVRAHWFPLPFPVYPHM